MYIHHQILAEVARHHRAEMLAIAEDSRRSAYARLIRRLRRRQQRAKRQPTSVVVAPAPVPPTARSRSTSAQPR